MNTEIKTQTTVEAVLFKDIREKVQHYLVIGEGKDKIIINVGLKTYERVNNLLNKKGGKP